MVTHIVSPNPKKCSKNQFYKNPTWRTATILKKVKCDISATIRPTLMKFSTMMHLSPPKRTKNQKLKNFKIEDGGRRAS